MNEPDLGPLRVVEMGGEANKIVDKHLFSRLVASPACLCGLRSRMMHFL